MKGYVMNKSNTWIHAMKRAIGPGEKVELNELYLQYGVKYNLAEGEEFVQWLKSVKLKDSERWRITLEEETPTKEVVVEKAKVEVTIDQPEVVDKPVVDEETKTVDEPMVRKRRLKEVVEGEKVVPKKRNSRIMEASKATTTPLVPTKLGVADIVGLSFREGKEVLPKIVDLKLLKYAYQEANQLSGKDSLCREIRKRIKKLELSR